MLFSSDNVFDMACYHPLKAYPVGLNNETGKMKYAISKVIPGENLDGYTIIPCGSCIGCRIDYSRQWADRCMLEAQDHDENYFVTLTYDDDHLDSVLRSYDDPASGEEFTSMSLNKRDLQLWHKSLRKRLHEDGRGKIRFFACGEYGSPENTMRPHFHEIVFGLHLDDLKFYKYNKQREPLYTSEYLSNIWKKGYVIVGAVTWQSAAYVARYVTKKLKGDAAELYAACNMIPPFTVMSRKPGIARYYYDTHPELFDFSYISVSTPEGSKKIYPSRYFKKLLRDDDPDLYQDLNDRNSLAASLRTDARLAQTELNFSEQLDVDEQAFQNRIRVLTRKEI